MLRSVKNLQGYGIEARDGAIGTLSEFYFDDVRWTVRYLVVNTGKWLTGREVLISSVSIERTDWSGRTVLLELTRDQVKNSPPIDTHKPVSRQQEAAQARYYGYPAYWSAPGLWGAMPHPRAIDPAAVAASDAALKAEQERAHAQGDDHLRRTKEVLGYHIRATDGEIGHVDDFLIEDDSWAIRYLVVNTSNWWFGNTVLVSPAWITSIDWADKQIAVDLTRDAVKQSPRFDPADHIDRQWEADYYAHFGRSPYWGAPPPGIVNPAIRPRIATDLVSLNEHDELAVAEAHQDPRGWKVVTRDDQRVAGKVDDLIVNTEAMKVRYLDIELEPWLTTESTTRHVLVPVNHAQLLPAESRVALEGLDADELRRVPTFMSLPPESGYDEQFVGIVRSDRSREHRDPVEWSVGRRSGGHLEE